METTYHPRTHILDILMEQYSWENILPLHMEMDMDMLEQCQSTDEDEFLRDILQQPALSTDAAAATTTDRISNQMAAGRRLRRSSSPRRYIISFDNSTAIPVMPEPPFLGYERMNGQRTLRSSKSKSKSKSYSSLSSKKRTSESLNLEPKPRAAQEGKKTGCDSQTPNHVMSERKRRLELAQKFIALSAIIPGLKKTDKTSIVGETINYVKQLQERVMELEQRNKRGKDLNKANLGANTSSETNPEDCFRPSELLPDVKAKVMENEILVEINCEKENGIELKITELLENLHLFVTGSSVLPCGNSTLGITIIAQMDNAYKMTMTDLMESIRQWILKCKSSNTQTLYSCMNI